jgi:hypothetical protein
MQHQAPDLPIQWPTNPIIMGGRYEMQNGQVARVYGVRRLLDGSLRLMMEIPENSVQEFTVQEFDAWSRA